MTQAHPLDAAHGRRGLPGNRRPARHGIESPTGVLGDDAPTGPLHALLAKRAQILAIISITALAAGALAHAGGNQAAGDQIWRVTVALLAAALTGEVLHTILVERHMGVDTIALVAMVGSLALGEELAGLVVGIMFTGGATLEELADARARRELTALIARTPKSARVRIGDEIQEVAIDEVQPGAIVVVRTGEVVPVDGGVLSAEAVLDTSTLTGEPLPVTVARGGAVMSGTANAGSPFELRADRAAQESAFAALVRLVQRAQSERAPFMRMADRYAGIFLPVTAAIAAIAWAISGDPVRALAVVVVGTPCPLILAAPIALVSGLSRAARNGVIVKGAGTIESLGRARTVLFDKTGTLTVGIPEVRDVRPRPPLDRAELLRLAASVDSMSAHILGDALVRCARREGLELDIPAEISEDPGQGIVGVASGRRVAVGSRAFLRSAGVPAAALAPGAQDERRGPGEALVHVAVDDAPAGVIVLADELREDAHETVSRLRDEGIEHVAMVSGDRAQVAEPLGRDLAIDRVYAEQSPEQKLDVVRGLRARPQCAPVVMVGDGVNDAPALALADVGIAMGAAGATVSSEAADAVITVDRLARVADAVHVGRGSLRIARQSVVWGMGLSFVAMLFAAAGYLPPVAGALLQEGIDLAVIGNALRALRV